MAAFFVLIFVKISNFERRKIMYIVKIIGIAALISLFGFLLTAAYHALVEMLSEESNFTTGGWRDE